MDNLNLFSDKADNYVKARPSYAPALLDKLEEYGLKKGSAVADIGSGTGIFTRQLLDKGAKVFAVELNDKMRQKAETSLEKFKNFISVNASAEATTLEDNSVDFVTCAQSFHWFDKEKFKPECSRILKQNGYVALIWNMRDNNAQSVKRLFNVSKKYCPEFVGFNGGKRNDVEQIKRFFNGDFKYLEFYNSLDYTKEKYVERCLSSSYSLNENDENYSLYIKEIQKIFDEFSKDGIYKMPNISALYIGKIQSKQ